MRLTRWFAVATVSAGALLAAVQGASASSFYIRTGQSAEGLGMQFGGAASGGIGLGSIGWNPATITMFPGRNSNWNATYIRPRADYDLQHTNVLPVLLPFPPGAALLFGTPVGTGEIGGEGAFVPASYNSWQITDRLWLGLATGAPFGLSAKPENENFAGQVYGRSARIKTINVAPTVGYKVTDWLSVGAAFQAQYLDVRFRRAIAPFPDSPNLVLEGDDISGGVRLGATVTPWQGGSFGVGFRSGFHHEVEGKAVAYAADPTTGLPEGATPLRAKINLPEVVSLGFSQQIDPQWQVHIGAEWENWSRLKRVPFINDATGEVFGSLGFEYDDAYYLSAGVEYAWSPHWTFRAGVSHEWSAISDRVRQLLIADNDRIGVSLGASFRWNEQLKFDVGYAHYFIKDAPAAIVGPGSPFNPAGNPVFAGIEYVGEAEPSLDVFSVGLTYRWDAPVVAAVPAAPLVRKY